MAKVAPFFDSRCRNAAKQTFTTSDNRESKLTSTRSNEKLLE